MRRQFVWAALPLALMIDSKPVQAADIKFCFEYWRPFSYLDDTGTPAGIQIDITSEALARAGFTASFEQLPYLRCMAQVEAGQYDAMLLTSDEKTLVGSTEYSVLWQIGVIVHDAYPEAVFESLDDFSGRIIGVVDGYEYPEAIEAFEGWEREFAIDAETNVRKVAGQRIDLTIDDVPWARWYANDNGLTVKVLDPLVAGYPQYAMWNERRDTLRALHDDALAAVLADGTVDRIYLDALGVTFQSQQDAATGAFLPYD